MSFNRIATCFVLLALLGAVAFATEAKVPVKVSPKQAYVFLDGVAIRDGNVTLKTTPGEHTIAVYNYGYKGQVRTVTVKQGKNEPQTFRLEPDGAKVHGPYGLIQIESDARAAVLLNGTAPEYFVGHVDEFNNHIGWSQQLSVAPGTHHVTVTRQGKTLWSGPLQVAADERVILYVSKNNKKIERVHVKSDAERPRFKVGIASAAISVAPVSGAMSATPTNINCNESSKLAYSSVDTLHSSISDESGTKALSDLSGELAVSPKQTTTYTFEASGPGGQVKQTATVNVNATVQSYVAIAPAEVDYLKVGDKVLTQQSSELKWSSTNADSVTIEPIGTVAAAGTEKLNTEPKQVTGKVDETRSYTLTATNVCGGSAIQTAQLRIKGLIEPYIVSVFFPTGYPGPKHPDAGLLRSQQEQLMKLVNVYRSYAQQTPEARIQIRGFADPRGTDKYNLRLSERRTAVVEAFLVLHGVPEDKIQVEALGETQQLDAATVNQLEIQDPFKVERLQTPKQVKATRLAYNRRVDIELQPTSVQTSRFYPHQASDAGVLEQRSWAPLKTVIDAQQAPTVASDTGPE